MSPAEISRAIATEINGDRTRRNPHGVDLKRCLVKPVLRRFADGGNKARSLELWLVLDEHPMAHDGYAVVFDDSQGQYGLANGDVFLGYYGTFLQTLDAM